MASMGQGWLPESRSLMEALEVLEPRGIAL